MLLPYTGAIEALLMALPAVFSIQYLLRWANSGSFMITDMEAGKNNEGRSVLVARVLNSPRQT